MPNTYKATYAQLIEQNQSRLTKSKCPIGKEFNIDGENVKLPQSFIFYHAEQVWCLELPRSRKQERQRYLFPIYNLNQKIWKHPIPYIPYCQLLPGQVNPYAFFKKKKVANSHEEAALLWDKYANNAKLSYRDSSVQSRHQHKKINMPTKEAVDSEYRLVIELIEKNLERDGYIDLFSYLTYLDSTAHISPEQSLIKRLKIAHNAIYIIWNECNTQDLTHNDVKPENIMIQPTTFHMKKVDEESITKGTWVPAFGGTPMYAAPERFLMELQTKLPDGTFVVERPIDNFAAGVLLSSCVNILKFWQQREKTIKENLHNTDLESQKRLKTAVTTKIIPDEDDEDYDEYKKDQLIDNLLKEMRTNLKLPQKFMDDNDQNLIYIIGIIADLTNINPYGRLSLESTLDELNDIIYDLNSYIKANQASHQITEDTTVYITPLPVAPVEKDREATGIVTPQPIRLTI